MSLTTGEVERLIGNFGFWSTHLLRVSSWVLAGVASGLFLVRLGTSRLAAARSAMPWTPSPRVVGAALLALAVCLASTFFALRPDEHFHLTIADTAYRAGDYGRAALYYEPVAAWGTTRADVYAKLGFSELKLRRYQAAVRWFDQAVALEPARRKDTREFSALAHLGLGETAVAVVHLEEALALADDPAEKQRLSRMLAQVRTVRP